MKKILLVLLAVSGLLVPGCKTVHFDKTTETEESIGEGAASLKEEEKQNEAFLEGVAVEEALKEIDIERTVIYVDRPVYYPDARYAYPPGAAARTTTTAAAQPGSSRPEAGQQPAKASAAASIQMPLKYVNGFMYYPWDDSFTYEIYCQPYRITDVMLQPGEIVLEVPYLSEDKVWEIGAGVSRKDGQDVQRFFLKPSAVNLVTTMIIITDRRVYHLLLKSFPDTFMVMVQWEYPPPLNYSLTARNSPAPPPVNTAVTDITLVDAQFLSFDYKMSYSVFKKPLWLPKRVYDDGRKTYIELDEKTLHSLSPVLFNQKNQRINYRVQKNLIIIDELIEKTTLISGKEKVIITKKRHTSPEPQAAEPGE
jgi:type IV secretion system protein VirB9